MWFLHQYKNSFSAHSKILLTKTRLIRLLKRSNKPVLLLHANSKISAIDFLKRRMVDREQGPGDFSGLSLPVCFVVATYAKFEFAKNLTDCLGVYIGKAVNIGDSIGEAFFDIPFPVTRISSADCGKKRLR